MARIPLTASSSRRKRERGGSRKKRNGWGAKWSDELKIKEGETAWVMLTAGDYPAEGGDRTPYLGVPMYKVQYTNKWGNQSWGYFRGQSRGSCTLQDRADCGDNRVSSPRYGEPNRFFMNVIHLDLFRREEVLDKSGEPLRYRHGKLKGEVVHRWEPVRSIREKKDIIKNDAFDDCTFFRKKFMELPFTHFEALKEVGRQAATTCTCGGMLTPTVYVCGECESILLDVEDTDLSEAEVKRFGDNSVRCGDCGHVGYPDAEHICDNCDTPQSTEFWQVAAQITKVREGQWPTIRVLKVIPITEYQFPDGEPAAVMEDDGTIVLHEDLQKLADTQFDLEEYTAAKENSYYSDILELREGDIGFASDSTDYGRFR